MHLRAFKSGSTFFSFWHRLHIPSLSIIFNVSTAWKRMLISRSASNTRFCTYFTFSRAWNKFHECPRLESVSLTRALRFHVFPHQESPFPMLEFAFAFSVVSLRVNSSAFGTTSTFSRAWVRFPALCIYGTFSNIRLWFLLCLASSGDVRSHWPMTFSCDLYYPLSCLN